MLEKVFIKRKKTLESRFNKKFTQKIRINARKY